MKQSRSVLIFLILAVFSSLIYLSTFGLDAPKMENSNYLLLVSIGLLFSGFLGYIIPRPSDKDLNSQEGFNDSKFAVFFTTLFCSVFAGLAYMIEFAMVVDNNMDAAFWTMIVGQAFSYFFVLWRGKRND